MNTMLDFLSGKKTYLTAGLGLVAIALYLFGLLDQATAEKALVALGLSSVITLRAAITKAQVQAEAAAQQVAALRRGERLYIG